MADMLGVTRGTLAGWLEKEDCPYVSRPDAPGSSWELNAPDVIQWFIDRETKKRVEKAAKSGIFESDDGLLDMPPNTWSKDEANRRKAISDALIRQIDLDKSSRSVALIKDITSVVTREFGKLREALSPIGAKMAADFGVEAGARAQDLIETALGELKADRRDWSEG